MTHKDSRCRIDFALITLTGNLTRYETVRPLVDAMPKVSARWYPIRTWVAGDWTHILPGLMRIRMRHILDSWRFLVLPSADAAVIHAFETWPLYVLLHKIGRRRPIVVSWPDAAPGVDHPQSLFSRLAVAHTDLLVVWSTYFFEVTRTRYPWFPADRLRILHPGIALDKWPLRQPPAFDPESRFRLLFIGGDLQRKGAYSLLQAMSGAEGLAAAGCVLDLCTQSAYVNDQPGLRELIHATPGVRLHEDLTHDDERLKLLYANADAFVLPTTGDASSWVALEAQATGIPVITTAVGGIPDLVTDGETGLLIPVGDAEAIVAAVERLRQDGDLRQSLVTRGRAHVEQYFDASKNVARLIEWITALVAGDPLPADEARDRVPSAASSQHA